MCNPVSWFYVVSAGVGTLYISEKTDSHTEITKEFGIRDTGIGSVCAGEFSPDLAKPSPDLETWKLIWDYAGHSRKPDWMDDEMEASLRRQLEQRCKRYVFADGEHETDSCRAFAFGNARLIVRGNCRAVLWDSASAVLWDSASAELWDSASAVLWDSASAELCGSASAVLYGSASAVLYGSASAVLWDSASAELCGSASAVLWDSASAELKSKNAFVLGRAKYSDGGYPPSTCELKVGKTYRLVDGKLAEIAK